MKLMLMKYLRVMGQSQYKMFIVQIAFERSSLATETWAGLAKNIFNMTYAPDTP